MNSKLSSSNEECRGGSLSGLLGRVQEAVALNFAKPVWIRAEINELRENAGHCYMELIEKSEDDDNILAKCRAVCWAYTYRMLKPYFESSTGQRIRSGIKILAAVTVDFHAVYGLTLNVRDIDPVFTVGEMAARRQQILRQLEADGIAGMNKELRLPSLPQRIAVISSPAAAGWGDFHNQLRSGGFVFYTKLFPAVMQGGAAEASIIAALDKIFKHAELFDAVVIIRGGGAAADLAAFDSYNLALNCAQFPLPIISGIGHQRDVSILDMVAHTSVKTPTAAAEFLISALQHAEQLPADIFADIQYRIKNILEVKRRNIQNLELRIRHASKNSVSQKAFSLVNQKTRLQSALRMHLMRQENKLSILEKSIESYSPAFLLKHGYSLTTHNGRRIASAGAVKKGDTIITYFPDGRIQSEVSGSFKK